MADKSIYDVNLPKVNCENADDEQELPFDCSKCKRKFRLKELHAFAMPHCNRGEQELRLTCPGCGHVMKVKVAVDSIQ